MSLDIAPMDSYRVFQRDTISGNPPGSTTTYDKGWGSVDLSITSDTPGPVSYRIVDGQDPTRVIQDWTASGESVTAGQSKITLEIAASTNCYIVQVALTSDTSSYTSTPPFFMGNIDAAAGQSKASGFFGPYAYGSDDPAAQPSQYLTPSFSTRVLTSDSMPRYTDAPTAWLQPGDSTTPGGAVVSTFPAEYLNLRQAELGVACALIGDSRPGGSVNDFAPGNLYGGLLDALVTRAGGKISNFIWNQGDADSNATGIANYQAAFQSVITQLDSVTTTPYRVIAFDYMWIHGASPDRFNTAIDLAKQAVATAHQGSYEEGISAGSDYVNWHPSMLARMLAADDLYRQIRSLDDPNEDKGPSLTGSAVRTGNIVDLQVKQDKGTELLGQVTEFGPTSVSFRNATPGELQSQFSAFEHGYTDAAHRIAILGATVVNATDIQLTLASTPIGAVDIWYRADYDGGDADINAGNAGIRDNFTADGVSYGVGLQTRLKPIVIAADGSAIPDSSSTASGSSGGTVSTPVTTGSTTTGSSSSTSNQSSSSGTPSTTSTGLVLNVSEDAWMGDAQYTISIDGQQVGGVRTATASHGAGQTEAVSLPTNLAAGNHTVTVNFLNDAYNGTPSTDRNLYVDGMKLAGSLVPNSSAVLKSQGPASLALTVPAGSAGAGSTGTTTTTTTTGSSSSTSNQSSGGVSETAPPIKIPDVSNAGLLTAPLIVDTNARTVLTVGAGKNFSTISAAVAASSDGDVILVDSGTYTNDFVTINHSLTIAGVGGMVNMVATEPCPNGKAILTVDDDLTLTNFTFTGASVPDGNGAGIRYESGDMTLINDAFFANQNGILGAAGSGKITIRNSLFSGNGSGTGYTHNMYIGQIAQLDVTQTVFENAIVGHELKSRALINNLTGNIFSNGPDGTASYDIDLPNGGLSTITGNLIEKGPLAENDAMIHFGGEGLPYANSALTIDGNYFVNNKGSSTIGLLNATTISASVSHNVFSNMVAGQLVNGAASVTDNQNSDGTELENLSTNLYPSNQSVIFDDSADHSVVLDANPLLYVRGGAGHLNVLAIHGHVLAVGGSGGMDYSEQADSGANEIETAAGSTNTLNLTGGDTVVSRGNDKISSGAYDVIGTISGTAHVECGSAYDKWSVTETGNLILNINGGDPNITLSNTATAVVTGNASGLGITSLGGSALVDITQVGGDHDGEAISFSITSGSTSAGLWNGKVDISTATGLQGSSIHLGKGLQQVTSNGSDEIWAGSGDDTVILSNGNAIVHAGSGNLGVFGRGIPSGVQAKVFGNGGTIWIGGDTGNITYYGDDLANTVNAGLSNISLIGGAGRMTVVSTAYSQNIISGSGGLSYSSASGSSGSIVTARGAESGLELGNSPFTIDSWGDDTITGGSGGSLTVHGNATISGGTGTRSITLMGNDLLNGLGVDTVTVTNGANVTYVSGQHGTITETGATLSVSLAGQMPAAADIIGGAATVTTDMAAGMAITTGPAGTTIKLHSGQVKVLAGGHDIISSENSDSVISISSDDVTVLGGIGSTSIFSQSADHTGLHFEAGSGTSTIILADGGNDNVVLGAGNTSISVFGGKADVFELFSGNGGGSNVINGFRSGVDQIMLHGVHVVSQATSSGSLTMTMSDNSRIQLTGVTNDQNILS